MMNYGCPGTALPGQGLGEALQPPSTNEPDSHKKLVFGKRIGVRRLRTGVNPDFATEQRFVRLALIAQQNIVSVSFVAAEVPFAARFSLNTPAGLGAGGILVESQQCAPISRP
jgi:hypothetical protein